MKAFTRAHKAVGKTIGFVPTMGYLHEGHMSLVKEAKAQCDIVVASIYVNPTQFAPGEDFDTYPRDFENDAKLLKEAGVDAVFYPDNQMMYPEGYSTYVLTEGSLNKNLCSITRPTFFKGVTTVVNKLFNIVAPDKAFFGLKDAQQVTIIKRMVADLNMDVQIVPCPIVREADGLAMSSRNKYLNKEARKQALALSKALNIAKDEIADGNRDAKDIQAKMVAHIEGYSLSKIDYVSIVDFTTLEDIDVLKGEVLIALAVYIDGTRLIDNVQLEV